MNRDKMIAELHRRHSVEQAWINEELEGHDD